MSKDLTVTMPMKEYLELTKDSLGESEKCKYNMAVDALEQIYTLYSSPTSYRIDKERMVENTFNQLIKSGILK